MGERFGGDESSGEIYREKIVDKLVFRVIT